jgi:hypothetical protein
MLHDPVSLELNFAIRPLFHCTCPAYEVMNPADLNLLPSEDLGVEEQGRRNLLAPLENLTAALNGTRVHIYSLGECISLSSLECWRDRFSDSTF